MTPRRLPTGGLIDRTAPLRVTVDGAELPALAGDTAVSAALAAGSLRVGDSIYRRRPRGPLTAGVEEPHAFVRVHGAHNESMLPATTLELREGHELTWEDGIGELDPRPDTAEYDHRYVHAEVVVVGAGPAGISAARAAVQQRDAAGRAPRVYLLEQDFLLGGSLLHDPQQSVEGVPALQWIDAARAELEAAGAHVMPRTCAFGSYDSNYIIALEKREGVPGVDPARPGTSRQRVWHITAGRVILATGAHERSLVFARNDLPGVMTATAAAQLLGRFGVLVGERIVVAATNDSAYPVARQLAAAGAAVTVVDSRAEADIRDDRAGLDVRTAHAVVSAEGTDHVTGARILPVDALGNGTAEPIDLEADTLLVAGGWSPVIALHSQRQGALTWHDGLAGFVPEAPVAGQALAGSVLGTAPLADCLEEGRRAGAGEAITTSADERAAAAGVTRPVWLARVSQDEDLSEHFVDFQRDNTAADVVRAVEAGMRSVEHIKRYTSISTGVDQGKSGGVLTIGLLTQLLKPEDMAAMPIGQPGQGGGDGAEQGLINEGGAAGSAQQRRPSPGAIGTTTFRAPFTPVAFAALAGRSRGELYDPVRRTSVHRRHVEAGAKFEDVGQWKRPWYYPQPGEDMDAAVARECIAARTAVGCLDGTTLGKIEVRGADAGEFLNRIYTNAFAKLKPGRQRYGVMCGPDGMVIDDGVVFRLDEDRFMITTTTGGAAKIMEWVEEWHQTEWPQLDVWFTSTTEQITTIPVVGPKSRDVIAKLAPDLDVSREGFEFMTWKDTVLASGIPARVARVTFSGELAFEVNVSTWYGEAVWDDIQEAGAEFGITPYGTETMHVLRAEKAYPIIGQDTDGTVTPHDLGMGWVVSTKKDFVGNRSFARAGYVHTGRKQMVALLPEDHTLRLPEGAQVVEPADAPSAPLQGPASTPIPMIGHVTSSYHSQAIGRSFALALVKDGRDRIGTRLMASFDGQFVPVEVHDMVVYDKEGARRDG